MKWRERAEECGRLLRLMRLPLWREVREATKCSTVVMKTFDSPNQPDFASTIHISHQSQARSNEERQGQGRLQVHRILLINFLLHPYIHTKPNHEVLNSSNEDRQAGCKCI